MKTHNSISHFTSKEQNNLHCIKKKIVEHLHPLIIYCVGSNISHSITRSCLASEKRTEEWEFECELLVVLSNDNTHQQDALQEIERLAEPFGRVEATIYTLDSFVQRLQEEDVVMSNIRRKAILLYEKDNATQQLPQPIKKQEGSRSEDTATAETKELKPVKHAPSNFSFMAYQPQNLYPQNLSAADIADPFIVIKKFFEDYDLMYVRKTIASWLAAVYIKKNWKDESPGNLLYFYERIIRLIEAVWLINQIDNSERAANISSSHDPEQIQITDTDLYCRPMHKKYAWDIFPRSLSRKEFVNPYKVFSKFFQFRTLPEWREGLHNILHISLINANLNALGEVIDVLSLKKFIGKMIDACHLISIREFEWLGGQIEVETDNTTNNETEPTTEEN